MQDIQLPQQISVEQTGVNRAKIRISALHPGYGTTVGNALRRVLLSSLPGSAVTAIKIRGIDHEFSAIPHVKEDVVDLMLNIKTLRLKCHSDEPVKLTLHAKGEKPATAKDIKKNAEVEIINPDHVIANISDKAGELEMDLWVQNGRGYVPVENQENKDFETGTIEIDAVYSPVRMVNYSVENVRVEQYTNYNALTLDVETDGSVTPEQAFIDAAKILVDQFSILSKLGAEPETAEVEAEAESSEAEQE